MMRRLVRGIEWLSSALAVIGGVVLTVMVFLVAYGVIMRYLFHTPKAWVNELVALMYLPVVALGIAYALKMKAHVRVDLLLSRLPRKVEHVLNVITMPLFLLYASLIVWAGWLRASRALASGMHSVDARIPFFPIWILLPIGAGVLVLQGLVELGRNIAALRGGSAQSTTEPKPH